MDRLMNLKEAAQALRVSNSTIRRMVKSGKLRYYLVGSSYRVSQVHLDECLKRCEVPNLSSSSAETTRG